MSKTVVITGCSGMDGSTMADYLLANTDYIIYGAHRRLSVPNHKNIAHLEGNPRFKKVDLDITDSENINQVIRRLKPDYFINFAANSFVGNSWSMPVNHFQTNAMGVLYCLEAIRNFSPHTRFYNAGSSEEFGDVVYSPQDINHPLRPRSPYGCSKVAARCLVKVYRESYNLYAVQGVLFNHEGVRRGEEFVTRKITKGVARIKKALDSGDYDFAPLKLGNLDAKRDWSDSEDFVDGVWKMMNQETPKDYVLASNETHTVREFVERAFEAAGIDGVWKNYQGMPTWEVFLLGDGRGLATKRKVTLVEINTEFYRPCEVELLWGDSSLARKELNWTPKTSFDQLVRKMITNDLNNP